MAQKIRAKFNVAEVTRYGNGGGGKVVLLACTTGSEENKSFSQYTPSGKIEMNVTVPEVLDQFQSMGEYYIDFEKVEAAPAAE